MNNHCKNNSLTSAAAKAGFPSHLKRFSALMVAALFVALWTAYAEDPDDQYLRIYMLIQQADSLNTTGQAVPALAKYREAQAALQFFQRDNPSWNVKVVSFRMNYLGEKLGAMKAKAPMPAAGGASEMRTEARTATPASTQVKL